ncbi:hypothetical protein [Arthrobacter sp. EPSL27]|uniref:hypothetical protein n=1 Tax=Arthrobacter sp. EPSL27 TaxID=1745378 RepID=UPI000748A452|nr:hypothetical protein [Arthrobacter sp. EPSL27]KUM32874.1 hypothetical protein AR539_12755 [Arthrobacter sp. EPSL27]
MSLRRRRRHLLAWSALPVLLALLLAVKLLSAAWFAGRAGDAFARADVPAAESAASALGFANILEPHKAPFAAGDALALRGDYGGARGAFEAALAAAPPADECRVRANLALSIERLGDASGTAQDGPDEALRLYLEALAVVDAAPDGCVGAAPADAAAGESLESSRQRLGEKIERLRQNQGSGAGPEQQNTDQPDDQQQDPEQPDADSGAPAGDRLEQLREAGQSAQQERNRGLEREDYLNGSGATPLTDRPW